MSRSRKRKPEWERFLALVEVAEVATVEELGPCWLWQGTITSSGHGSFKIWHNNKWKAVSAHKYSYLHHNGCLKQPWLHIRHMCDVKHCVNPNHLCEGTREDNMQDMMERNRGRMQFGSEERKQLTNEEEEIPF